MHKSFYADCEIVQNLWQNLLTQKWKKAIPKTMKHFLELVSTFAFSVIVHFGIKIQSSTDVSIWKNNKKRKLCLKKEKKNFEPEDFFCWIYVSSNIESAFNT